MYVVDALVFSSLMIKDEFFERAESFLISHGRSELVTVDLAFVETANVLWKHARVLKRIPEGATGGSGPSWCP
ncbi:MAG: type II toxin-antitoxin system VapC family toxin [Candidatus Korarchaeota archaeon]|nr:type II toxin-antitoxin system VapC family toxin [Candidatus Korarchaeota archaeon]